MALSITKVAFGCDSVETLRKRLAAGCSADEKTDLFSRTAAAVYRLPI